MKKQTPALAMMGNVHSCAYATDEQSGKVASWVRKSSMPLKQNHTIKQWKISSAEPIGTGGQGSVWSVRNTQARGPKRAMKICDAQDEQSRERFKLEVDLLEKCDHVSILQVIDKDLNWGPHVATESDVFAYYVTEHLDGSLEALGQTADLNQRLKWFRQTAEAVDYLHKHAEKILHRDIKPANILLAREPNRIVLSDFGIASPQASQGQRTLVNEVVGTPDYRAPEIAQGGHATVQSDIFSLGRVLEWLVSGRLTQGLTQFGGTPRQGIQASAAEAIDGVINKATAPRAAERFESVAQLLNALPELVLALPEVRVDAPGLSGIRRRAVAATGFAARELEGSIRRDYQVRVQAWLEGEPSKNANQLLEIVAPRIAFEATQVQLQEKRRPELVARLFDDLTATDAWPNQGITSRVNAWETIVFLAHNFLGAVAAQDDNWEFARSLAESPVRVARASTPRPLGVQRALHGLGEPLRHAGQANDLLRTAPTQQELRDFFPLTRDFENSLCRYQMFLNMLELRRDAAELAKQKAKAGALESLSFDVFPCFLLLAPEVIEACARQTYGSPRVVIAAGLQRQTDAQAVWSDWVRTLETIRGGLNPNSWFPTPLNLGVLAA